MGGLQLVNAEEVRSLLVQVQHHLSLVGMQRGEITHQHSLSISGEDERRAVKTLLARFRQLPADEQRQVPALLNGLGKLQVGAGDFEQAKQTFNDTEAVLELTDQIHHLIELNNRLTDDIHNAVAPPSTPASSAPA